MNCITIVTPKAKTRRPLARSGMGWVLLSAKPDGEIEKLRR